MTPEQKAAELINKMYYTQSSPTSWVQAKECTLIAVDEILNLSKIASLRRNEVYMELEYWMEVKQEIEKL